MPGADGLGRDQLRAQCRKAIQIREPMGRFDVQHRDLARLGALTSPMHIPGEQTFKRGHQHVLWRREKGLFNMGAACVGRQTGVRHNFPHLVRKIRAP
jgi:hypothetical protein